MILIRGVGEEQKVWAEPKLPPPCKAFRKRKVVQNSTIESTNKVT